MLSNAQTYAVQILVARDLKLNPAYSHTAETLLKKRSFEPFLIKRLSLEASKCVKLINENNLLNQAKNLVKKYC